LDKPWPRLQKKKIPGKSASLFPPVADSTSRSPRSLPLSINFHTLFSFWVTHKKIIQQKQEEEEEEEKCQTRRLRMLAQSTKEPPAPDSLSTTAQLAR